MSEWNEWMYEWMNEFLTSWEITYMALSENCGNWSVEIMMEKTKWEKKRINLKFLKVFNELWYWSEGRQRDVWRIFAFTWYLNNCILPSPPSLIKGSVSEPYTSSSRINITQAYSAEFN